MGKGSASERRVLRGSLFFRLGNGLLAGVDALPDFSRGYDPTRHHFTNEGGEDRERALSPFSIVLSPDESPLNTLSSLHSPLHFLTTTKETQTKEHNLPSSSLLSSHSTAQSKDEALSG